MTDPRQWTRPPLEDDGATVPPPAWDEWFSQQWQSQSAQRPRTLPDLAPLFAILDALRRVVPLELQEQLNAFQRELLLTVRALIDWYLERLDGRSREPSVEDIPID